MNSRDRLYTQRALIAWADWIRDGRTFRNAALGYPTSTVEYALYAGAPGVSGASGSRVPTHFNHDREVERIDKVFWRFPQDIRETLWLVYFHRKQERHAATILGTTRHKIRKCLSNGYRLAFHAISTENLSQKNRGEHNRMKTLDKYHSL